MLERLRRLEPLGEARAARRLARRGHHAAEHAMGLQDREQFARHVGRKRQDAAVLDPSPFRVRARQHEHSVAARAEDLCLLAAHHVGRAARVDIADARQEAHRAERRGRNDQRRRGDLVGARRAGDIGGLAPALPGADHAGGEDREIGMGGAPGAEGRAEIRLVLAGLQRQRALALGDGVQRSARRIDEIGAERARAPIDADQHRRVGQVKSLRERPVFGLSSPR